MLRARAAALIPAACGSGGALPPLRIIIAGVLTVVAFPRDLDAALF